MCKTTDEKKKSLTALKIRRRYLKMLDLMSLILWDFERLQLREKTNRREDTIFVNILIAPTDSGISEQLLHADKTIQILFARSPFAIISN